MVLKPEKEKEAEAIFRKWGLDFAIVGKTTPTKRFIVKHNGATVADLPIKELGDEAPVYDRPHVETPKLPVVKAVDVLAPLNTAEALLKLIGSADLMPRNLDRRVEVLTPVVDPDLQARLGEVLDAGLRDDVLAWALGPDGRWARCPIGGEVESQALLQRVTTERAARSATATIV